MACSDITVPANAPCDFSCLPAGDQWAVLLRLYLLRYGTDLDTSVLMANTSCIASCIPEGMQLAVLLYLEQQIAGSTATPQQLIDAATCQAFAQSAGMELPTLIAFMQDQLGNTETPSQLANDTRCILSCIPDGMLLPAIIYVAQLTAGNTQSASELATSSSPFVSIVPRSYYIPTIRRILVVAPPCTASLVLTQDLTPVQATYGIGDVLTFTITVTNNGPDTAAGPSIAVALPAMVVGSLTVSEAYTSSGAPPNQVLTIPIAAIANGGNKVVTVSFTLLDTITAGAFSLVSTVTTPCTNLTPADSTKTTNFTTVIPPTDMVIWLDASILTSADNTIINPWLDLTANHNDFAFAGNALVRTNIQNGFRGVYLGNGVGGTSAGPNFAAGGPFTCVCVFKLDAGPQASNRRALQSFTTNFGLGANNGVNDLRCVWVNVGVTVLTKVASETPARCHVVTTQASGTRWICGTITDQSDPNPLPGNKLCLGAVTIAEPMWGHWFELRVFNRVLTNTEITTTMNYLKSKWALP